MGLPANCQVQGSSAMRDQMGQGSLKKPRDLHQSRKKRCQAASLLDRWGGGVHPTVSWPCPESPRSQSLLPQRALCPAEESGYLQPDAGVGLRHTGDIMHAREHGSAVIPEGLPRQPFAGLGLADQLGNPWPLHPHPCPGKGGAV